MDELNRICNTYCRSRIHPTVGHEPDPNCYFKSEGVEAIRTLITTSLIEELEKLREKCQYSSYERKDFVPLSVIDQRIKELKK